MRAGYSDDETAAPVPPSVPEAAAALTSFFSAAAGLDAASVTFGFSLFSSFLPPSVCSFFFSDASGCFDPGVTFLDSPDASGEGVEVLAGDAAPSDACDRGCFVTGVAGAGACLVSCDLRGGADRKGKNEGRWGPAVAAPASFLTCAGVCTE